jgi:3-hydroxyacyl-[acyl-carrier-protein] dehydratase
MLKGTFFTILSSVDEGNEHIWRVALNESHPIFQAHFVGDPMMPGACMVQMIKELASERFGRAFFVCAVKNMKFLQAINPLEAAEISVKLIFTQQEDERISAAAVLYNGDKVFSKSVLLLEYLKDA